MAIAGLRRRHVEDEGESVFVSMTDLTVSFLFILLVLLAFFATQIKPDAMVPRSEYEALELELSEAHAGIIRLEEAIATERERLERLEQERRALADRLAEANDVKRRLEEALATERRLIERLEQEQRVLVDRLAEADRTITELHARVEALRAELAVATATIDDLSAQILVLKRDLERMRSERDDARAHVQQLSSEVELLLAEVEQLTRALDACRRDRDRLRMQLAEMLDPDSLAAYVEEGFVARERLLERLAQRIRHSIPGVQVTVDTIDGVIRFRADKLFPTGTWRIPEGSLAEQVAHAVGDALAETLPCYTLSPSLDIDVSCEGAVAAIETIQIEGHTDDVGLSLELREREKMVDNYDLSARRGAETLRVMTRDRPELHEYLNLRGQPVLSFAGYGQTRPINQEDTDEARDQNRRIDIRFILQTPRDLLEVEQIRSQLTRRRADLPSVVDESRP